MKIEIRNDSVFISGYVNAVERYSKPIRDVLHGKVRTFIERIKAGVFKASLKRNRNVVVLLNHDKNRVLASVEEETAMLREDNIGLYAEVTIRDKQVVKKAREGKLSGWSFGFYENADELGIEGETETRTVTDMDLVEISILDDTKEPAYYGTSIESRSKDMKRFEIREQKLENEDQTIQDGLDIDELADVVAEKVIDKLKPLFEALKSQEKKASDDLDDDLEDDLEDDLDDVDVEENREIDYSDFEERIANLKKD